MTHHRTRPSPRVTLSVALLGLTMIATAACSGAEAEGGPRLAADAPLPSKVPDGTVLRVGDPQTEVAMKESGLDQKLARTGVKVKWANISGGPESLEAFRANALDVSSVADVPPLFAHWTGTDIKIVAARETVDPLAHPVYDLGIAPGVTVHDLADLKGKKIAYSPGQAQGALVLNALAKAGLTQDDVELVEMQSVDDAFVNALGSKQVDVAPLGQQLVATYKEKYAKEGGTTIKPGVRDDSWTLYAPVETVEDADKAAALKKYVAFWGKANDWINHHPEEFARGYYQEHEGLPYEDGLAVVKKLGKGRVLTNWDGFIARQQKTADHLRKAQGQPAVDVEDLYDRRYEKVAAQAAGR